MTHEQPPEKRPKHGLGARIREHIQAAEVAAEEAAGYGFLTETVEAVEAAVRPAHELGRQKHEHQNEDSGKSLDSDGADPDAPAEAQQHG
jgi:hypothetical protein